RADRRRRERKAILLRPCRRERARSDRYVWPPPSGRGIGRTRHTANSAGREARIVYLKWTVGGRAESYHSTRGAPARCRRDRPPEWRRSGSGMHYQTPGIQAGLQIGEGLIHL